MTEQWEPERLTRLRREKAGLEQARAKHMDEVKGYDEQIRKVDLRIREEVAHMGGAEAEAAV